MSRKKAGLVQRTLLIALLGNFVSFLIKLVFGILANSIAMLADAVHALFDSLGSVIGIYGNRVSAKPPDLGHPYGHGKFEQVAALGITVMMFAACFNIVHEAIDRAVAAMLPQPTILSFVSMGMCVPISLAVSIYERRMGKATSSMILEADSFHTLTHILADIVVIVGLFGARSGFGYADPLAAVLVCLFMAYVGFSIFRKATAILMDRGVTPSTLSKIEETVDGFKEDVRCHSVRGKTAGDGIYIDMHVTFRGDCSVEEAHAITDQIEKRLKKRIKEIREIIIHIEPQEKQE